MPLQTFYSAESRLRAIEDWLANITVNVSVNGLHTYTIPGLTESWMALFGNQGQTAQPAVPMRSNWPMFPMSAATDAVTATTGIANVTVVPVQVGDIITSIGWANGATAGGTLTNRTVSLYAGTNVANPPYIAGSVGTNTTATTTASVANFVNLTVPLTITAAMCPYGYVYAGFAFAGTTMPTAMGVTYVAATLGVQTFPNANRTNTSPVLVTGSSLGGWFGSSLTTTLPTTITTITAKTIATVVFLV